MNGVRNALQIARRYANGGSDNTDIDPVVMPNEWNQLTPGPHGVPRLTIPRYNEAKPVPPLPESPDQKATPVPQESFSEQREREVGPEYHPIRDPLGTGTESLLFGMGQDITAPISEGPTVQNLAGAAMASPFIPPGAEGILGETLAKAAKTADLDLAPEAFSKAYKTHAGTGSNPGGFFSGFYDGIDRYVKPMDEDHARNEVLANRFYEMWGVPVAHNELTMTPNGKYAVASHIIPNTVHLGDYGQEPAELLKHFPADAMLANWDAIGLNRDNVLVDANGKAWRIDHGGALEYRAQGKPKGAAFGSTVGELTTMREQGEAGQVFKDVEIDPSSITAQKIAATTDDQIRALVKQYGPKNITDNALLAEKLIKRRDDLTLKYGLKGGPGTSGVGLEKPSPLEAITKKIEEMPVYGNTLPEPSVVAQKIVMNHSDELGEDPEGIAQEMYNIAKNGHTSYVDDVYKALPVHIQEDVNAALQDLIDEQGDPWSIHEPEATYATLPKELPASPQTAEDEKPKNQTPLKLMQLNKTHSPGELAYSLAQISYDEAKDNKKLVTPKQVAKILGIMSNTSVGALASHMADMSAMERNNVASWIPSLAQKNNLLGTINDLQSGKAGYTAADLAEYEELKHQHDLYDYEMAQGLKKKQQESTFLSKAEVKKSADKLLGALKQQGDIKTPQGGKKIGDDFIPQHIFDAITPMDYTKYKVKNGKYLTQQDFPNANIENIKKQGYDLLQLWHGQHLGDQPGGYFKQWFDPLSPEAAKIKHYKDELGVFMAHDPGIASGFEKEVTLPYVFRSKGAKVGIVNYPEAKYPDKPDKSYATYGATTNERLSKAGMSMGYDMLVLKNISDIGGPGTQYIILNPSRLKAPTAKFDPAKMGSMESLSGIVGIPAAGAATYGISQQGQPQFRGGGVKGAMRVARGYATKTGVQ